MNNPVTCAKLILENKQITGVPAVSLRDIAKSEGIRFLLNDYPADSWDGTLLFKGEKRAILINTHRGNTGRHNFTFAHELGHYFLDHQPDYYQDGEASIKCTAADMADGKQPREVDANKFAQELLMPEDSFRFDMIGSTLDFTLVGNMANKYMVSKQACSYRIVGLTQAPCIIIFTEGMQITSIASSYAAKTYVQKLKAVPCDTAAFVAISDRKWHEDFTTCDSSKWLCREVPGETVYECTHIHKDSGNAMTIIKW